MLDSADPVIAARAVRKMPTRALGLLPAGLPRRNIPPIRAFACRHRRDPPLFFVQTRKLATAAHRAADRFRTGPLENRCVARHRPHPLPESFDLRLITQ
jgi:hypothetical protein